MPSTPSAYPQVVPRSFACFRVLGFHVSTAQAALWAGFDSRQLHRIIAGQGYKPWPVFSSASVGRARLAASLRHPRAAATPWPKLSLRGLITESELAFRFGGEQAIRKTATCRGRALMDVFTPDDCAELPLTDKGWLSCVNALHRTAFAHIARSQGRRPQERRRRRWPDVWAHDDRCIRRRESGNASHSTVGTDRS